MGRQAGHARGSGPWAILYVAGRTRSALRCDTISKDRGELLAAPRIEGASPLFRSVPPTHERARIAPAPPAGAYFLSASLRRGRNDCADPRNFQVSRGLAVAWESCAAPIRSSTTTHERARDRNLLD